MIHFERNLTIGADAEAVWAVLERFMHIDEFAPQIVSVDALTSGRNGAWDQSAATIFKMAHPWWKK